MKIERYNINGATVLITGIADFAEYASMLSPADIALLEEMKSPARRAAGAAWRALVRSELGNVATSYNEVGAPIVSDVQGHKFISVSHTNTLAAVIIADTPCGIDMEPIGRDLDRAATRYISSEEAALPEADHNLFKVALWCAKEALYKISGCKGLDLRDDLHVTATDLNTGKLSGEIRTAQDEWKKYDLDAFPHADHIVVCTRA